MTSSEIPPNIASLGVIGCGYWGKNHVRNLVKMGALTAVCDATESGRRLAAELAPQATIYANHRELFEKSACQGVVIATPAETHFDVTREALQAGCDVLVEKPLALKVEHGEALVRLAEEQRRILMVGHVLEYHPAISRLREIIAAGEMGTVRYIYSNRLNLGKIRREENILWSFAPHDIAIVLRLVGTQPFEVLSAGGTYVQPNIPDVTVTQLLFDNGVRAHIFVSWLHPYKEQKLVVVGSKKMAVFDDVRKTLQMFDQRVEWRDGQPLPVEEGVVDEPFGEGEPLRRELDAFVAAIVSRRPPLTDGRSALDVLRVLAAAQRSLVTQGQPVQMPMGAG